MNIEKTISEHAVSDILTPMLESQDRIVTEDVAPLFNKATGLDTPTASGSVTTTIEESRSVITAIIRKAWTATLTMLGGASVLSSIAAAYTYLRNRLQGNETYGIPDRRSEISASSPLAANLALLNDRKIGGVPGAADGMSLVHLLCSTSAASSVTKIVDDNVGWEWNVANSLSKLVSFSNANLIIINCDILSAPQEVQTQRDLVIHCKCKQVTSAASILGGRGDNTSGSPNASVYFDELEEIPSRLDRNITLAGYLYFMMFHRGNIDLDGRLAGNMNQNFTKYLYAGGYGAKTDTIYIWKDNRSTNQNIKDIEFRNGVCQNLTMSRCVSLTAENMYNHILCRLKQDEPNCGSGVTITLGTTNIEKLEAVDEYNTKLTELEDTYGYTFA